MINTVFAPYGAGDDDGRARLNSYGSSSSNNGGNNSSRDTLSDEEEMTDLAARRERIANEHARAALNDELGRYYYDSRAGADATKAAAERKRRLRRQRELQAEKQASGCKAAPMKLKDPRIKEMPLEAFIEQTAELQEAEDRREQERKMAAAARDAEECKVRNRRWAEVKARMTARNAETPGSVSALSLRSAGWGDDDDEDEEDDGDERGGGGGDDYNGRRKPHTSTVRLVTDPLLDEERPIQRLMKRDKLPWAVQAWQTSYNWFRWMLLAMFYMRELADDQTGYYHERRFE